MDWSICFHIPEYPLPLTECMRPVQLAEISRVLRPGGVFVASTFLKAAAPLGAILGDDAVRPLNQVPPGIRA